MDLLAFFDTAVRWLSIAVFALASVGMLSTLAGLWADLRPGARAG